MRVTLTRTLVLAVLLTLPLTACDGGDNAAEDRTPRPTASAPGGTTPGVSATAPPAVATTAAGPVANEAVALQAEDGAVLRGHLYAAAGPQRRVVILAHGSAEDQRVWQRFARDLAERGIAAFTFDFRGYGESGGTKDASTVQRDMAAAVLYLKARDYPLIYLLGPELGGIAALKVAATQDVAGLVTIATPLSFMGVSIQADLPRITERKLFVGPGAEQLSQLAPDPKEVFTAASAPIDQLFGGTDAPVWMKVMEFVQR